ncbi:Rv3654c family TadE-like protein [Bailinhaonella thermotolerans]|uniref:Helicase n=1 Tax=Bailinhaonella thermotolerans TaxID=1070861 RepID=A0A3A3ZYH7_9ACTN|nr:Rv3654c family TadE-like protein [Bailinhaonella thermotolerans]RJL20405.1 helicase [Bailinhaonella thermotolerans]
MSCRDLRRASGRIRRSRRGPRRVGRSAGPLTRGRYGSRGSATVWVAGVIGLVWVVVVVLVSIGAIRDARHRAQAAADLSALAAARQAHTGERTGCGRASAIAEANRARMVRCGITQDGIADVTTEVVLSEVATGVRHAIRARARAGPVAGTLADAADPAGDR